MTQHELTLLHHARQRSHDLEREAATRRLLKTERTSRRRHLAALLLRLAQWLEPSILQADTPLRPTPRHHVVKQ